MHVRVGETRLFFDVEGCKLRVDGPRMREVPTLLLLHGGPGLDHSLFKPLLSPLTDVAQIVYLDHRSQGAATARVPSGGLSRTVPMTSQLFATRSISNIRS